MPTRTAGVVPIRKVTASGIAGALTTVLVFVLNTYIVPSKPITPDIAAAMTTVLAFAAGYLTPPAESERVITTP